MPTNTIYVSIVGDGLPGEKATYRHYAEIIAETLNEFEEDGNKPYDAVVFDSLEVALNRLLDSASPCRRILLFVSNTFLFKATELAARYHRKLRVVVLTAALEKTKPVLLPKSMEVHSLPELLPSL